MRIEKSRMMIYIEFHHRQNPKHIEDTLRQLSSNSQFPIFRQLLVGIDHKNLKRVTPQSVAVENKSK